MNSKLYITYIVILLVLTVVCVAYVFISVYLKRKKQRKERLTQVNDGSPIDIAATLTALREEPDSKKKAAIIMTLIAVGYILVHFLINSGEDYDEQRQEEKYCSMVSSQVCSRLDELDEVKHGKY